MKRLILAFLVSGLMLIGCYAPTNPQPNVGELEHGDTMRFRVDSSEYIVYHCQSGVAMVKHK